jgi:hypothetical protein
MCFQEYGDIISTDMVSLKIMKCVPGGRVAKEWDGFYNICSVSTTFNTFKDWLHSCVCLLGVIVFVTGGQVANFMLSSPGLVHLLC